MGESRTSILYTVLKLGGSGVPYATITVSDPNTGSFVTVTTITYASGPSPAVIAVGVPFDYSSPVDPLTSTISRIEVGAGGAATGNGSLPSSSSATTTSTGQDISSTPAAQSSASSSGPTSTAQSAAASTSPARTGTTQHGVSSGTVAGAAVGCFIAGALIAALLTWLFLRSRNKQRPRGAFASTRSATSDTGYEKPLPHDPLLGAGRDGAAAGAAVPLVATGWEQHLPQSESDNTLRQAIKTLFDQIELHVENFYRDATVPMTASIQSALLKVDSPHLPDSVAGLLPITKTPTILIKHCLAALIVSHIAVEGDTVSSFLPITYSGQKANASKPAFTQAFSRWRVLTSYLHPPHTEDHAYLAHRDATITTCTDTFCTAFAPWAKGNNLPSRRTHLLNIMKSASETGILVFSQSSGFVYTWDTNRPNRESGRQPGTRIVVLPGFVKISGENGRTLPGRGSELVAPSFATL